MGDIAWMFSYSGIKWAYVGILSGCAGMGLGQLGLAENLG